MSFATGREILSAGAFGPLLFVLLAGCRIPPVRLYDGPPRPPEEVVRLDAPTNFHFRAVDDRMLTPPATGSEYGGVQSVEFLPGYRTIQLAGVVTRTEIDWLMTTIGAGVTIATDEKVKMDVPATTEVVVETIRISHSHSFEAGHSYYYGTRREPPRQVRSKPLLSHRYEMGLHFIGRAKVCTARAQPDKPAVWEERELYLIDETALEQVLADAR
ncbi:MAG: hypothetical protein ACYS0E_07890 [Planctomycetota bacterium]